MGVRKDSVVHLEEKFPKSTVRGVDSSHLEYSRISVPQQGFVLENCLIILKGLTRV